MVNSESNNIYVRKRQACYPEIAHKLNLAFGGIHGHPNWCRQKSTTGYRNVQ